MAHGENTCPCHAAETGWSCPCRPCLTETRQQRLAALKGRLFDNAGSYAGLLLGASCIPGTPRGALHGAGQRFKAWSLRSQSLI